jgi:hypothetical protein
VNAADPPPAPVSSADGETGAGWHINDTLGDAEAISAVSMGGQRPHAMAIRDSRLRDIYVDSAGLARRRHRCQRAHHGLRGRHGR